MDEYSNLGLTELKTALADAVEERKALDAKISSLKLALVDQLNEVKRLVGSTDVVVPDPEPTDSSESWFTFHLPDNLVGYLGKGFVFIIKFALPILLAILFALLIVRGVKAEFGYADPVADTPVASAVIDVEHEVLL